MWPFWLIKFFGVCSYLYYPIDCFGCRGVQHLLRNDRRTSRWGGSMSIRAMCLLSVSSIFQKYVPFVYFMEILWHYRNASSDTMNHFLSLNLVLAWRALSTHQSQFVWYRKLSILFSRYTYFNQLVELRQHHPLLPKVIKKW